jgi:hypothetical protein
MFRDDDDDILAYRSGYAFVYSGNDAYSGKLDDGNWYMCGKARGNETQSDALNAALNQWIEALPAANRAALEQILV